LPSCSHGILPVCMSVSKFSLFIKKPGILEQGPTLLPVTSSQLIICNHPLFQLDHILRSWWLELERIISGET
jgi:hypothetical protein